MKYTTETYTGAASQPRHRDGRGPVRTHNFSLCSSSQTRALNKLECDPRVQGIEAWLEDQIRLQQKKAADKYLKVLRAEVAELNLSRHIVYISAAMGSVNLMVCPRHAPFPKYVDDLRGGNVGSNHVIRVLQEIDQFLDGQWDWANHLDKQVLTRQDLKAE